MMTVETASESEIVIDLPVSKWQEDLDALYELLVQHHLDPFYSISERALKRHWQQARGRLESLDREGRLVELIKLPALLGDGHTRIDAIGYEALAKFLTRLPIDLRWYEDGLYVRAATEPFEELLDGRLVSLGGESSRALMDAVTPLVSHENVWRVRAIAPQLITRPQLLQGTANLAAGPEVMAEVEVRGALRHVQLPVSVPSGQDDVVELSRSTASGRSTQERWDSNLSTFAIAGGRVLVMKYDLARDRPDGTLADKFGAAFRELDDTGAEVLAIDLRSNAGGDNRLNWPLVYGILARPDINRRGRVFALVGRDTFSAAMNCTLAIERHTNVTFVGEPTGTSPGHFGDAIGHTLPNTRLKPYISSLRWEDGGSGDTREMVKPQIEVTYTAADYGANRDAALEAVVATLDDPDLVPNR